MTTNARELRDAIQSIVDAWENGNLAQAVRDAASLLAEPDDTVLSITITTADVEDISLDNDIDSDTATARAEQWADAIRDTASQLVWDQLQGAIVTGQP